MTQTRWLLLAALLLTLTPALSWAGETVELSDTQKSLNEQGVQALWDGDNAKAMRVFKTALTLGEANVLYLNYGRALSKEGRCQESYDAYEKVESAPAVDAPNPQEIAAVLESYQGDLLTDCPPSVALTCVPADLQISVDGGDPQPCPTEPLALSPGEHVIVGLIGEEQMVKAFNLGAVEQKKIALEMGAPAPTTATLQLSCTPAELQVSIDGGAAAPCPSAPMELAAGPHSFVATLDDQRREEKLELKAGETTTLNLAIEQGETVEPPVEEEPASTLAVLGWTSLGIGSAFLITAGIFEWGLLPGRIDELKDASDTSAQDYDRAKHKDAEAAALDGQNIVRYSLVFAGVFAIAGGVMVYLDMDDETDQSAWSPILTDETLGLGYTTRW